MRYERCTKWEPEGVLLFLEAQSLAGPGYLGTNTAPFGVVAPQSASARVNIHLKLGHVIIVRARRDCESLTSTSRLMKYIRFEASDGQNVVLVTVGGCLDRNEKRRRVCSERELSICEDATNIYGSRFSGS